MKFLAALIASASATAYTTCKTTVTYYGSADTTCASSSTGTDAVSALVNLCTYSTGKSKWFKITSCTTSTADLQWHTTAECSDTPAADQKMAFTSTTACIKGALTGSTAQFYAKISAPAGITSPTLCAFTIANYAAVTCGGSVTPMSTTFAAMGMGST